MRCGQTMLVLALMAALPTGAKAERIAYDTLRADVIATEDGLRVTVEGSRVDETLVAGSRVLILQDGLYAQAPDGALSVLYMTHFGGDPVWRHLKDYLEAITVEPEPEGEEIALMYQLAFRAGLDANPRTALEGLLAEGVTLRDARDAGWQFDPQNSDHLDRAAMALRRLGEAISKGDLRVGGSASTLVLGFPSSTEARPDLYWPRNAAARLRLAPGGQDGFSNEAIRTRMLPGWPDWFAPASGLTEAEVVACLPFGGCGYLPADAVAPVVPLWIVFDRETRAPLSLVLD